MTEVLDYVLEVSKSELKSRYCVPYPANTLGKGTEPLIHHNYGLNSMFFSKNGFGIKWLRKVPVV